MQGLAHSSELMKTNVLKQSFEGAKDIESHKTQSNIPVERVNRCMISSKENPVLIMSTEKREKNPHYR